MHIASPLSFQYCCDAHRRKNQFPWLDRIGIPHAREGSPDITTLPRSGQRSKYVVGATVNGRNNGVYDDEEGADDVEGMILGNDEVRWVHWKNKGKVE